MHIRSFVSTPLRCAALTLLSAGLVHALEAPPSLAPERPTLTEFRANTFTPSTQAEPSLAVAEDGSFTVVWASRRQASGRSTVLRQRFAADGTAREQETPLGLWRDGHLTAPVFAYAADGSAWGAWQSVGQDGDGAAIIARHFDADGLGGSEVLVNAQTDGDQMGPVLTALAGGRAAVAWTHSGGPHAQVVLRLLDGEGRPLVDERVVDDGADYRTTMPSIIQGADGRIAVAYVRFDQATGASEGVWLRLLNAAGDWTGAPVPVGAPGAVEPVIASTADGYVVAWHAVARGQGDYDVFAKRLRLNGAPASNLVRVNDERQGLQNGAAIAVGPAGEVAIAYNHRLGRQRDVLLRTFDATLTPLDAGIRLTERASGTQVLAEAKGTRRLAFTADGALIAAWHGAVDPRDTSGIGVTVRRAQGAKHPTPLLSGVTPQMQPYLPSRDHSEFADGLGAQPHVPPIIGRRPDEQAERALLRSRNGIGFTGILNSGLTPPDPHLAVGPEQLVAIANGEIAFFDKDGTRTFVDTLVGFWEDVSPSDFLFDPEVIYDQGSGRFIAMTAEAFAPGNRSYALVAVSDDTDPNGSWFTYRFDTTATSGNLFDSPNIGVTDDAVVITGDGFGLGAVYAVYAYDKASLLNGDPPAIAREFLYPTITQSAGFPRVTTGTGDTLYLVEHKEAFDNNTQVRIIAFTDLLGTPSTDFVDVTVPPYGVPEDPPQSGTTSRPDTFDARFWSVDQGPDGNLWATHHINPSRVVARWYELALNGWPTSGDLPGLVQSGDIDLGPDVRTYFSAINAGPDGSVAITYARSSPNEFISMESVYRTPCSAPGTVVENLRHQDTVGGYTLGRWGDYAAVQFDPADPAVYWAHHEYAQNNSWLTWVQSVDTTTSCALVDVNRDGAVNGPDARLFLRAYNTERCLGDWNRDGLFTQPDLLDFFALWSSCRD